MSYLVALSLSMPPSDKGHQKRNLHYVVAAAQRTSRSATGLIGAMSSRTTKTKTIAIGLGLTESQRSLAPKSRIFGGRLEVRAKRIDVEATAAVVARVHRQLLGTAARLDVEKHSFDTGLVKIMLLPV